MQMHLEDHLMWLIALPQAECRAQVRSKELLLLDGSDEGLVDALLVIGAAGGELLLLWLVGAWQGGRPCESFLGQPHRWLGSTLMPSRCGAAPFARPCRTSWLMIQRPFRRILWVRKRECVKISFCVVMDPMYSALI